MSGDYTNKQGDFLAQPASPEEADLPEDLPELPPLFAVVILNDDKTPMRFVVELIERVFHYSRRDAIRLMMKIHIDGRGSCGSYSEEVAQTKSEEIVRSARALGWPLQSLVEPLDGGPEE